MKEKDLNSLTEKLMKEKNIKDETRKTYFPLKFLSEDGYVHNKSLRLVWDSN